MYLHLRCRWTPWEDIRLRYGVNLVSRMSTRLIQNICSSEGPVSGWPKRSLGWNWLSPAWKASRQKETSRASRPNHVQQQYNTFTGHHHRLQHSSASLCCVVYNCSYRILGGRKAKLRQGYAGIAHGYQPTKSCRRLSELEHGSTATDAKLLFEHQTQLLTIIFRIKWIYS